MVGGEQYLTWWMWQFRKSTEMDEPNPLIWRGGWNSNAIHGMEWWRHTAEWNFEFWVNNS